MVRKNLSPRRWLRCTKCRGAGKMRTEVEESRTRKRGRGEETYTVKVPKIVDCDMCDGKGGYYPVGSE